MLREVVNLGDSTAVLSAGFDTIVDCSDLLTEHGSSLKTKYEVSFIIDEDVVLLFHWLGLIPKL